MNKSTKCLLLGTLILVAALYGKCGFEGRLPESDELLKIALAAGSLYLVVLLVMDLAKIEESIGSRYVVFIVVLIALMLHTTVMQFADLLS